MRAAAIETETENLFEVLANKAPVGLYIVQDGKFCYTNPTFQRTTGYREDELLGRDSLKYVAPEYKEKVRENAIKTLKGENTLPYQVRVTHKSGNMRWVTESVAPIQYHGRRATLGCFIDITEHKQAEEALQAERNKLQSLIDAMEDTITIQDTEYNIIYQNEPSKKASGGDHLGEKCYRAYEGREKVCDGCPVEKAFKDGKSHTAERKTAILGKGAFWENTANPIRDAGGRVVSCLELARDITKRKQAEEAIQAERNKLQSLIDAMEDHLTIRDRDYNLIYLSERVKNLWGDHTGEKCYRVFEGRDKVCDGCPAEEAFKDGKSHTSERQLVLPSGEVGFWENTVNPIRDAEGRIVSCLEVARNITERKKAEEVLNKTQAQLSNAVQMAHLGPWEYDAINDLFIFNDIFYELFHTTADEVGGYTMSSAEYARRFVYPEDVHLVGEEVRKALQADDSTFSRQLDHRIIYADGEVGYISVRFFIVKDETGRTVRTYGVNQDITERKKQEQALADEATRRRLLVDKSLDGIVVLDVDARVVEANQRFADMLGYTMEEVHELHTWDWDKQFPPEKILEMGRNVDEKGFHLETKHTRKDGSVIDVDISISGIMYGGRKLIFCIQRDVTERNRTEKALKESEEGYRELANSITDVFFAMDEHLRYTYWNKASEILTGIRTEDAIGKSLLEIFQDTPDTRKAKKVYRDVLRTQQPQTFVNDFDINGRHYIFEISAYPSRGGISVVTKDITERKQAEEKLKLLSSVTQQVSDAIMVSDPDFNITYVNKAAQDLFGYSLEEMLGKHFDTFNAEPIPKSREQEIQQTISSGKFWVGTLVKKRKDGSTFLGECHITPLYNEEGKISSYIDVLRDITERKRAEEALRESEERFRIIFNEARDGIVVYDAETGVITDCNEEFERLTGRQLAQLRKCKMWELRPSYMVEETRRLFNEIRKRGELGLTESAYELPNSKIISIEFSSKVISVGGKQYTQNIVRDITERKKMEEAINLQRAHFQQLFDNSPDAIIMMDTNDRAIQVNKGFETLFGYSNKEVKGRTLIELIVPDVDVQETLASLHRIVGGEIVRKESVRRRKDGSLVDVSVLAYPIFSNDKLIGSYAIYSNITERKQAEEAIKQAAEEWRKTFDSISDAISIHDKDFRILRVNKAFADMFHMKPSQIIGRHCYELHKENKLISDCPHRRTLATRKPAAAEFYESHIERHLRESTSPLFNDKGEVVGTVHITRDITEQKQQNERLMMADRLASLGELAAGTAHELNNPLTSVIGFSQLLMEKDIPDGVREDVKLINNEAQRAAGVTKNLLTFARKHAPVKQLTQINNVIEDVLKLRIYEQKVNGIKVEKQLAHDLPEIMIDYFQMQQVFLNIIINAEYFMTEAHNGGTLTITTKKQNDTMRISFADDGPGIPEENLKRIFDPFFTTKEPSKGTGLGLSICHGIVTEHGGQIYVKSQLGKGATFIVELPIKSP
jgi:PAS domain S-box-containing protein